MELVLTADVKQPVLRLPVTVCIQVDVTSRPIYRRSDGINMHHLTLALVLFGVYIIFKFFHLNYIIMTLLSRWWLVKQCATPGKANKLVITNYYLLTTSVELSVARLFPQSRSVARAADLTHQRRPQQHRVVQEGTSVVTLPTMTSSACLCLDHNGVVQ